MSIIIYNNDPGIDFSSVSLSEASYMINSYIEESLTDIQIKYLLTDKRSLQEYGTLYFTEENEAGKQKLSDKIKQIIKTVWDAIVGIFKKIRDFFKDMITKIKEFFSKIQSKIFGKKKEDKKEEPKAAEKKDETKPETKPAEKPVENKEDSKADGKKDDPKPEGKKEESKPEEKPVEKKEEPKKRPFNTEKINNARDEYNLHRVDQKELVRYMRDLPDTVFRDSIDKNVNIYYNNEMFINPSGMLSDAAEDLYTNGKEGYSQALRALDRVRKFLKTPLSEFEVNTKSISRGVVLDCAFGNFSGYYRSVDRNFKYAEKTFDNLSKNVDKLEQRALPLLKELLKCTTTCSKMYSHIMIHNSRELMKVVHYIYNNYDRDGVSVKESVDWSSIL